MLSLGTSGARVALKSSLIDASTRTTGQAVNLEKPNCTTKIILHFDTSMCESFSAASFFDRPSHV